MVFYKNSADRLYAVNARVCAIDSAGQTEERLSVGISYAMNDGQVRREWVTLWNNPEKRQYQCNTFRKHVRQGDEVLMLCKGNTQGYNSSVLRFATQNDTFRIGDNSVYFGKAEAKETNIQVGPVTAVATKTDGQIAMRIANWNRPLSEFPAIVPGRNYIVVAHGAQEAMTADGRRVIRYLGDYIFPDTDVPDAPADDSPGSVIINIGCYTNRPIKLAEILPSAKTDRQKKQALAWLQFVADEWQPTDDPELQKQKRAVIRYLAELQS